MVMAVSSKHSKKTSASIFDVSDVSYSSEEVSNDKFYPEPTKGVAGVYKATVRFIPNLNNIPKSIIHKYVAYLENPLTNEKRTLDSYRTLGKEKQKECPICQMFFKLYNEEDASLRQHDRMFIQKDVYYGLVQVLEDDANPQNVGRILWWRFGKTVHEKLDQEKNPTKGKGHLPHDVFDGRPFLVEVYKKGGKDGNNSYDRCKFFDYDEDEPGAVLIDGEKLTMDMDPNEAAKWIIENSPDIERFDFAEWDDSTRQYFDEVVEAIYGKSSNGTLLDSSMKRGADVLTDEDEDDEDEDEDEDEAPQPVSRRRSATKKVKKEVVQESIDDSDPEEDIEDIFDDDGIFDDIDFDSE